MADWQQRLQQRVWALDRHEYNIHLRRSDVNDLLTQLLSGEVGSDAPTPTSSITLPLPSCPSLFCHVKYRLHVPPFTPSPLRHETAILLHLTTPPSSSPSPSSSPASSSSFPPPHPTPSSPPSSLTTTTR